MTPFKTVALHTLGCKLNYAETSSISRLMENDGFIEKQFNEPADVYVINTCSVTENANKECRQLVRRVQKQSPNALIVITGCYAQLKPVEIAAIKGVDLILGAAEKFNIISHLKNLSKGDPTKICSCDIEDIYEFKSSYSLNSRTRSFLKVQDGCDYNCSFCTIPAARGKSRSNNVENILKEVQEISLNGVKEIVLTGINLGDYGKFKSHNNNSPILKNANFLSLIKKLEKTNIDRFRISSIEPNLLTTDILNFVAGSKKFMPHFHIPLQSGSNKILGLMRRRYKKELYAEKIQSIKEILPHCSIGVDVITGFPGESEEDFKETYQFILDLDISYLHVFTYSERPNTLALDITPTVPINIRHARTKELRTLSFQKQQNFNTANIGKTRNVLFEGRNKNNMMEGYSDNYIRVTIPYDQKYENKIVEWVL